MPDHAGLESTSAHIQQELSLDDSEDSSSSLSSPRPVDLNAAGEDGWEDAESDKEQLEVKSLFDEKTFESVAEMLAYCQQQYEVDVRAVVRRFGLDFYGCIKLINYIRSETGQGNLKPNLENQEVWSDDKYLQPVLDDDAVLFGLDELVDIQDQGMSEEIDGKGKVVSEESQPQSVASETRDSQAPRDRLQGDAYLSMLMKETGLSEKQMKVDSEYFDSYSYNDIHETMLKDEVRTSTYRDFIYDYKHLFNNKTVLDVGCGTGILSMFCAKAGAHQVLAVDNSGVVEKAKQIFSDNSLNQTISCVRGMIEVVDLPWSKTPHDPAHKVDIIVSEWMGYCLLYEAMLNSILWARDRYLDPKDGLMVPSHCTLRIAPFTDPEYLSDSIGFWNSVYGFDMRAMTTHIYDDIVVRSVQKENLAAQSVVFKTLPLHTITVKDLEFEQKFQVTLDRNIDALDGWVIWFDTFMLPGRDVPLPEDARAETWKGDGKGVAFTTGPHGTETHWKAGMLIIDHSKKNSAATQEPTSITGVATKLSKGQTIDCSIVYSKNTGYARGLSIKVTWNAVGTPEHGSQLWLLQ